MARFALILWPLLSLVAGLAQATLLDDLKGFYRDVSALAGDFEQRLIDEDGETLERYAGRFWIQRPGQFLWRYDTPYEQQMGSNGKTLWHYDVELKQLTLRDAQQSLGGTPARLLGGELDQLDDFIVAEEQGSDGQAWLILNPAHEDADFEQIRIALLDGKPEIIELFDRLGQQTRMQLHDLRVNPERESGRFDYPHAEGVTIVDERAPE